jgi:hypothetical protein
MGPPAETKTSSPRALIWVAVALAIVALGIAVYFTAKSDTNFFVVYRVTLLLLFFAISTVSALIFNTSVNLKGGFWGLSVGLGGSAALWLVALLIFTNFYPESNLTKEFTLQSMARDFWAGQLKSGWYDYAFWKRETGDDFSAVLGANETETLRNLFWSVYYRTPGQRLQNVQITTVFLYFGPKYTLKFQRIRGNRESGNTEPFTVYYGGQTSNDTGKSGSVLLVGRHNGLLRVKESYFDGESEPKDGGKPEHALAQADIDCLIVSQYNDEVTSDGDYITTDMKEFATNHRGGLRLGIAAFKPIEEVGSWRLASRTVTDQDDLLPLAFRKMPDVWQNDLRAVEGDLQTWLKTLDSAMEADSPITGKSREMLHGVLKNAGDAVGHPIKASELLTVLKNRRSASMPEAEDVVLTMFLWQ